MYIDMKMKKTFLSMKCLSIIVINKKLILSFKMF